MLVEVAGATFPAIFDGETTGLVGTLAVRILDSTTGDVVVARSTDDIIEIAPADYRAELVAPDTDGSYLIVWDLGDPDDPDGTFSEELLVNATGTIPAAPGPAYATVEELAALLKVNPVSRVDQLERVLATAAAEIDAELGLDAPYTSPPPLVVEVNLERAVEHWQQMQAPFGILGLGADTGATHTARDSWDRHAHKLAPLKVVWGLA